MAGEVELEELPFPPNAPILVLDSDPPPKRYVARFEGERYSVIVSRDNMARDRSVPDRRWHVSVAGKDDVPPWNALTAIAHAVRPGVMFCVPMPPASMWLNQNPNVLHVDEIHDDLLTEQWAYEGLATRDTPS